MRWLALALLSPGVALAYNYLWDWTGPVDRFEMRLDAGPYVSVGLPPLSGGTYTLPGDPALTGSHSAVVRACTVATGCSPDSNTLTFTVAPALKPAAPTNVRLSAAAPPALVESLTGTKVFVVGVDKIIDSKLAAWTLGPKDPLVEGGLEFVILINGVKEGGTATFLCYSNRQVFAFVFGASVNGQWFAFNGLRNWVLSPTAPVGCV